METLDHHLAVSMAHAILDVIIVPDGQRMAALNEIYCVCKAGVEAYRQQLNRMERLEPSGN